MQTKPTFNHGKPEVLFQGSFTLDSTDDGQPLNISPDGKRFLMMKEVVSTKKSVTAPRKINIVINWFEELKQHVPIK